MALPTNLRRVLSLPTAAFVEDAVIEFVFRTLANLPFVRLKKDRYGNVLCHYKNNPPGTPALAFTAHMDHPGFVAQRMVNRTTLDAAFRGWVETPYFKKERVRFWSGGRWVRGRVTRVTKEAKLYRMIGRTSRPESVEIRVEAPVEPNSPGMWDFPDPVEKKGCVHARGCDDMAGCAAMIELIQRLSRKKASAEVYCLFTRAEEVGFIGAIGASRAKTLPRKTPIIAIETSKALPNAPIGAGPILRVGDKTSVFTPEVTQFCDRVAREMSRKRKNFAYQRKLMDGGTCESTAYISYGYGATGICLALGNYHNMDGDRGKIAPEYVSIRDWKQMVDWFEALVMDKTGCVGEWARLRGEMDQRFEKWLPTLSASSKTTAVP